MTMPLMGEDAHSFNADCMPETVVHVATAFPESCGGDQQLSQPAICA